MFSAISLSAAAPCSFSSPPAAVKALSSCALVTVRIAFHAGFPGVGDSDGFPGIAPLNSRERSTNPALMAPVIRLNGIVFFIN